jgi:hypothetical protein
MEVFSNFSFKKGPRWFGVCLSIGLGGLRILLAGVGRFGRIQIALAAPETPSAVITVNTTPSIHHLTAHEGARARIARRVEKNVGRGDFHQLALQQKTHPMR